MADSLTDAPSAVTAVPAPQPRRLRGALTLCHRLEALEVEEIDDARFRCILSTWGAPGEVAWVRITRDSGVFDYPCRVLGCRDLAARGAAGAALYAWTLVPLGSPFPV